MVELACPLDVRGLHLRSAGHVRLRDYRVFHTCTAEGAQKSHPRSEKKRQRHCGLKR